jgi:cobalt-zinc-cadmium resistance protein CzcA
MTPWRRWEFVPKLSEGAFVVAVMRLPGTSLEESMRANTLMEQLLLKKFPNEVENVWSRVGTAEVATDPMGPEESDMFITLKPREMWQKKVKGKDGEERRITTQDELADAMRKVFEEVPGQRSTFKQPIKQRIDEMTMGVQTDVAIKLFGDDLNVLEKWANEVQELLGKVEGAKDVTAPPINGQPYLEVRLDRDALARHGLTARTVFDRVEALGGKQVGDVVEGQLRFPLAVRLPERMRRDADELGRMLIVTPAGEQVPLSALATLTLAEGPSKVEREWGRRRAVVQCNVEGRDVATFVEEARVLIRKGKAKSSEGYKSPRYHFEIGGQFETLERARWRLALVVPIALLLIFVLLYVTYARLTDVLLVFLSVPFAGVGGLLALQVRHMDLSIPAAVGFIALSGVSVLNSMVLVTFIRQLVAKGRPMAEAVEEAALTRLRPVLMTALVASLGFVPMALSTGVGAEVQRPLATVVIGGVVTSTLLTLFVLPVLYKMLGGDERRIAEAPDESGPSRAPTRHDEIRSGSEDSGP